MKKEKINKEMQLTRINSEGWKIMIKKGLRKKKRKRECSTRESKLKLIAMKIPKMSLIKNLVRKWRKPILKTKIKKN